MGSLKRAVFLDRDGTLNIDPGYISDPSLLHLLPGVPEALFQLHGMGFLLVVVTNQSGINRGFITKDQLKSVHRRLSEIVETAVGIKLEHIYYCCHRPDEFCDCRKPNPGLLVRAAQELQIDLSHSVIIGDRLSDIEAGKNAGCGKTIFITGTLEPSAIQNTPIKPSYIASSLLDAAQWLEQTTSSKG